MKKAISVESLLDAILSPCYIWKKTANGQIILEYANAAAKDVTDGKVTTLIGLPLEKVQEQNPDIQEIIKQVFATGKPQKRERTYTYITTSKTRDLLAEVSKIDENHVLVITHDITLRKQIEKELHSLTERYQRIINSMAEGLSIEDKNGYLIFNNRRTLEMLGYKENELLGIHWEKIIPKDQLEKVKSEAAKRPLGISSRYETELLRKDGTRIPVSIAASPMFDRQGNYAGNVVVFSDISALKESEAKLKEAQRKLKEQKDEIELYLDILAHDLRNHLMVALGYLDLLHKEKLPPPADTYLAKLRGSVTNTITLLNNIAVLLKKGLQETELQPTNLWEIINTSINTVKDLFKNRTITFINHNITEKDIVLANPLLNEVFLNLFTNSVKYTPNDPVIIEVAKEEKGDYLLIVVSDNGSGIPPEKRKDIFERFGRFKKEGHGSGLGLFIVKSLISAYQGKVWIENRVKDDYTQGTTFKILLKKAKMTNNV